MFLGQLEYIKTFAEFKDVMNNGRKTATSGFVLFDLPRERFQLTKKYKQGSTLVGLLVTKKIGNAVMRNLLKRRLRVVLRNATLASDHTYIILLRQQIVHKMSSTDLQSSINKAVMRKASGK